MQKNGSNNTNGAKKSDNKKSESKKSRGMKPSRAFYTIHRRWEYNKLKRILRASGQAEAQRWANERGLGDILFELEPTIRA